VIFAISAILAPGGARFLAAIPGRAS
jgi:hypothetical protein